jgi:hypothetical protein
MALFCDTQDKLAASLRDLESVLTEKRQLSKEAQLLTQDLKRTKAELAKATEQLQQNTQVHD